MSSFYAAAEVSLRTEIRKEEREEGGEQESQPEHDRQIQRGVLKGRQTRSMRCRFTAQSVCLRPGALLVVIVLVGDWAACPSLQLQSRSCIMTPIRFTLFFFGMSLCVCVCVRTEADTKSRIGLQSNSLVVQLRSFWVGIGRSSDLRCWLQGFPLMNSERSDRGQCQSKKTRTRSLARHNYRKGKIQGRCCLRMIQGGLNVKSIGRKNGYSLALTVHSKENTAYSND